MKRISSIVGLVFLFGVSSSGWSACPDGYEENARSGDCRRISNFELNQKSSSGSTTTASSSSSTGKYNFASGVHKVHSFHGSNLCSDTKIGTFEATDNNKLVSRWTHPLDRGTIVIENVSGNLKGLLTGTRGLIEPSRARLTEKLDSLVVKFVVSQPGGESCRLRFVLRSIFRETDRVSTGSSGNLSVASKKDDGVALELEFWQSVKDSHDVDMYMAYLESYPEGQFVSLAKQELRKLESKSTVSVQQASSHDSNVSIEIEFWKSVKDSDDPDMFREYLRQFPQGVYAGLAKLKVKKLGGETTSVAKSSIPNLDYGDYYALVIGNNDYELLPDLKTAVNDATKVASVLEYDYGFKVELLTDATRSDILKSLFGYRKVVGESDNLLIYYAGHGELDEGAKKGYWLPVDAARDDPSNWIMTDQVVAQITAMEAKHVMVVADSCFSGELTRGIKIDYGSPNWIQKLVKKKARIALTSGGLEPVSDSGGGSHSVFSKVFISLLEENMGVLNTQKLFTELRPRVMKNTRQTPEHGTIHLAGDEGGDFLFVRQ